MQYNAPKVVGSASKSFPNSSRGTQFDKKSDLGMKIFKDFVIFVLRTKIPLAPDEVSPTASGASRMDFGAFTITFGSLYCISVCSRHSRIKIKKIGFA